VLEGANGPTTYAGEEILMKKGIVVCPDLLINVEESPVHTSSGWRILITLVQASWLRSIGEVDQKAVRDDGAQGSNGYCWSWGSWYSVFRIGGNHEYCSKRDWNYAMKMNICFRDACLVMLSIKYSSVIRCGITIWAPHVRLLFIEHDELYLSNSLLYLNNHN